VRHSALLALAVVVCGCGRGADRPPELAPYAGIGDIMDGIVVPYSQNIFDAVAYENGQLTRAPRNDDEWHRLKVQALAVAESGNLLMMSGRAKDSGDWMTFSHNMRNTAAAVAKGADLKDVERVLLAGGELYETCTACHAKYLPE
jgi:hypothetical protein